MVPKEPYEQAQIAWKDIVMLGTLLLESLLFLAAMAVELYYASVGSFTGCSLVAILALLIGIAWYGTFVGIGKFAKENQI
jgi:hypothetical protein